jgi:hypothetical protein
VALVLVLVPLTFLIPLTFSIAAIICDGLVNHAYECESLLDVAVVFDKFDIVMKIITPNLRRHATPPTTLHTLFHAASLSVPDVLLQLPSADSAAVEPMKLNPYVVVNGAARGAQKTSV